MFGERKLLFSTADSRTRKPPLATPRFVPRLYRRMQECTLVFRYSLSPPPPHFIQSRSCRARRCVSDHRNYFQRTLSIVSRATRKSREDYLCTRLLVCLFCFLFLLLRSSIREYKLDIEHADIYLKFTSRRDVYPAGCG